MKTRGYIIFEFKWHMTPFFEPHYYNYSSSKCTTPLYAHCTSSWVPLGEWIRGISLPSRIKHTHKWSYSQTSLDQLLLYYNPTHGCTSDFQYLHMLDAQGVSLTTQMSKVSLSQLYYKYKSIFLNLLHVYVYIRIEAC